MCRLVLLVVLAGARLRGEGTAVSRKRQYCDWSIRDCAFSYLSSYVQQEQERAQEEAVLEHA